MYRNPALLCALFGIGVIVIAIVAGPALSAPEFSWIRHSTSEQAGQHLPGAWAMRAGFVAYGSCTAIAAILDRHTRPFVRAALFAFGLGMIATAVWSNASIISGAVSDLHEDYLHSVASGVVGTAFATACAARLFAPHGSRRDGLAWIGLLVSVLIPMAMSAMPEFRGILQRSMFAVSFVFVAREFSVDGVSRTDR